MAPGEREAFLREACGSDAELRAEVQRLLDNASRDSDFLQPANIAALLRNVESSVALFTANELICKRYKIVAFIARGGMGEVYEVDDTELRTRVALKTLPEQWASSPRLVDRFRQEILLSRTVTHPNV